MMNVINAYNVLANKNENANVYIAKYSGVVEETKKDEVTELKDIIIKGLKDVRVDGRCEIFESRDKEICAIVDYAHNKESVNALIGLAKEYYPGKKICLLFGCPGGKAYNRREEIGTIAADCDYVIITEDDPAGEELSAICDEIVGYVKKGRADCRVIYDREEAIGFALDNYRKDTVILIAGKGSERTQKRKNGPEEYLSDSYYVRKRLSRYEEEILSAKDYGEINEQGFFADKSRK